MKIPRNISSELPRIGPSESPSKYPEEVLPRYIPRIFPTNWWSLEFPRKFISSEFRRKFSRDFRGKMNFRGLVSSVDVVLRLPSLSFHDDVSKTCIEVDVVLRLSSLSFHDDVSKTCTELKKHLITASYVDDETSMLREMAKNASITVLGETTSHNLAFSMNLSPLNSVRQRKNVLNPETL
ncbi:hypothetical protein F2Q69_00048759 [Brassica cretica]|uniref:Uncharacterized protein n=1 Tax=Brassica cretica TaxID=69181 RepID=A0A8S9PYE4_BRACR|nr:hypothetical protein F2Q69_00048759 [Brassica cretica]